MIFDLEMIKEVYASLANRIDAAAKLEQTAYIN